MIEQQQHSHDIAAASAKVAPAIGVSGASYTGWLETIPLHELVLIATLIYTLLQIYFLVKDRLNKRKPKRKKNEDERS